MSVLGVERLRVAGAALVFLGGALAGAVLLLPGPWPRPCPWTNAQARRQPLRRHPPLQVRLLQRLHLRQMPLQRHRKSPLQL